MPSAAEALQTTKAAESEPEQQNKPRMQHLGYLDGLRASAAIFVIFCHMFGDARLSSPALPKHVSKLLMFLSFGHFAVDLFIVLSGFCLMLPVIRNGIELQGGALHFFKKRARRILPPYFAALTLSIVLILTLLGHPTGTNWDGALPITQAGVISHFLLVQDLFRSTAWKINYALWSISVEWRIYFLFPILVVCWRRWGGTATAAGALLGSLVLLVAMTLLSTSLRKIGFSQLDLSESGANPQFIGLFSLGMLGACICFENQPALKKLKELPWRFIVLGLLLVVFALAKLKLWHHSAIPITWTDYAVGLMSASAIVLINNTPGSLLHKVFSWRPLVFLGTFSYSIYLIHLPVLQFYWQYLRPLIPAGPIVKYLVTSTGGVALIVAVAYLFFLAFERPFLNSRSSAK